MSENPNLATAQQFLNWIFQGNLPQALALCEPDVCFIGSRPTPSNQLRLYGKHFAEDGARTFFGEFSNLLIPGDFQIEHSFADGDYVTLYGTLHHTARQTQRPFISDWALILRFSPAGKLQQYHFYEDTAALEWSLNIASKEIQ